MSRFLEPDHSKGDERTIGGYAAVHDRPAALEGPDGMSYSVEILTDRVDDARGAYGAFFLFLRWTRMGEHGVQGHLETECLAWGADRDAATAALGAWEIPRVVDLLTAMVRERMDAERAERIDRAERA
jgi:hypothetical protein